MVKYNINTKYERDPETRFPYINPSPTVILERLRSFSVRPLAIHVQII